jgi:hypothetical protein
MQAMEPAAIDALCIYAAVHIVHCLFKPSTLAASAASTSSNACIPLLCGSVQTAFFVALQQDPPDDRLVSSWLPMAHVDRDQGAALLLMMMMMCLHGTV